MLILTRKPGESVYIGDTIKVTIVEIKGHQIRVGIDAPTELRIYREEIYLQILEENKQAAAAALAPESGLEGLSEAWMEKRGDLSGGGSLKKGLPSFTTAPVSGSGPQVVVKRKKKKGTDEPDPQE